MMKKSKTREKSAELREQPEKFEINSYQTQRIIGRGSFGVIYQVSLLGQDIESPLNFALKLEKKPPKDTHFVSQIQKEVNILKELQDSKGFATLYNHGVYKSNCYMVTSLLGVNLQKALHQHQGRFDQETTLRVAYQMIDRVAALHEKGFLHRDIKPENFVLGYKENAKILFLIDFGLSKKYIEKNEHIPMNMNRGFVGTARYASPHAHRGYEQGRRDDLIAIGYLIMYFLKGKLPWQGMMVDSHDRKYQAIGKMKEECNLKEFFEGYDPAFLKYMSYVTCLLFDEKPNYDFIRDLFQEAFEKREKQKRKKMLELEESKLLKTHEDVKNYDEDEDDLNNQIMYHVKEEIGTDDRTKLNTKFYSFKVNPSRSSTLRPNYDYSSCDYVEEEVYGINKIHNFFKVTDGNKASKGIVEKKLASSAEMPASKNPTAHTDRKPVKKSFDEPLKKKP